MDKGVRQGVYPDFRRHLDASFGLLAKHLLQRRDDFRDAESGRDNVGVGKVEEFLSESFLAGARIHVGINMFLQISLTFSCCSVSPRTRWRHRAFCRCGELGRPAFCNRKCQTGVRAGARLTCRPNLRERADGARKLPAEWAAAPVPPP